MKHVGSESDDQEDHGSGDQGRSLSALGPSREVALVGLGLALLLGLVMALGNVLGRGEATFLERWYAESCLFVPLMLSLVSLHLLQDGMNRRTIARACPIERVESRVSVTYSAQVAVVGSPRESIKRAFEFLQENHAGITTLRHDADRVVGTVGEGGWIEFSVVAVGAEGAELRVEVVTSRWLSRVGFDFGAVIVLVLLLEGLMGGLPFGAAFKESPSRGPIVRRARERIRSREDARLK